MKKNIAYMAIYQILILIVPLISMPYVSRVLGPTGIGVYSFTNSIVGYFMLLCMLGIQLYGKREIAKESDHIHNRSKIFLEIYFIQISLSLLSILLYMLVIWNLRSDFEYPLLLQSIMIFSAALDISWFYFGIEKFKITITRNMIIKIISLMLIFLLVNDKNDVNIYIIINALSNFISQLILWLNLNKYINFSRVSIKNSISRMKNIMILFIPVLSVQLYVMVGKTILGVLSGVEDVGFFENADRITRVPIAIITSLGQVMLPRMTYLIAKGDKGTVSKYIDKSLVVTMFFAIACTFGIYGISETFVPLFLGETFNRSIIYVKILSPILLFISWGNVFRTQYILPNNMDKFYTKTVLYALIVNVFINLLLDKNLGALGAIIASVVSEGVICIYQSYKLNKQFDNIAYIKILYKYVVSGIIMASVILIMGRILPTSFSTVMMQLIFGTILYVLISMMFENFSKDRVIYNEVKKIFLRNFMTKNS